MTKKAILLINLGTPDNCDPPSVRRYLKSFLNDPRVVDLPAIARWVLVNLIIIPFRFKKSAKAYQKIWSEKGSPLLTNSLKLKTALAAELGEAYQVELGMRYGNPSIPSALTKLKDASSLKVIPLFPQYSSAANGSAVEHTLNAVAKLWNIPEIFIQRDFYQHPGFISAYTDQIKQHINNKDIDLLLFSYHGLPERQITKSLCQAKCDRHDTCPAIQADNVYCYRAQCYATSHLIAKSLGLAATKYSVAFQSRLGRTPWIKPYTDLLLPTLIQKGIKNIAVVSPSFIADCLETLEEVNIRLREQWKTLGGNDFIFIPCINDSTPWVKALAGMVREN